jgi:DNA-directed RNA polymerase subunit RPC12/RpoP
VIEDFAVRLPLDKIYRAFPELDRFSDAACRRFVRQAARRNRLSQLRLAVMAIPLAGLVLVAWYIFGAVVGKAVPSRFWEDMPGALIMIVYWIAGPVVAILSGLMLRDSWLRRMIAKQLIDTRCTNCSYSLLGLEVLKGKIQCPECGHSRVLAESGLTASDFVAPPAPAGQEHRAEGLA